jgi:enoyl-CoA hydratase/carnithine racemase
MNSETPYSQILFTRESGVATVTLNRPEKMNSFTLTMARELRQAWETVRDDQSIRAVVLRGADGRAFCTGVDVQELWPWPSDRPFDFVDPGAWLGPKSNRCWKPVICAVHGLAAGGAFYFLNECDIVICSEEAQFFDPHVTFGMVTAVEPVGALRMVPYQEVMRMSLMGNDERICARTALRISLVTEVLAIEKLYERAAEIAALVANKPAAAIQGTIKAIWESRDLPGTAAVRNALKYVQLGNPIGMAETDRGSLAKVPWTSR